MVCYKSTLLTQLKPGVALEYQILILELNGVNLNYKLLLRMVVVTIFYKFKVMVFCLLNQLYQDKIHLKLPYNLVPSELSNHQTVKFLLKSTTKIPYSLNLELLKLTKVFHLDFSLMPLICLVSQNVQLSSNLTTLSKLNLTDFGTRICSITHGAAHGHFMDQFHIYKDTQQPKMLRSHG